MDNMDTKTVYNLPSSLCSPALYNQPFAAFDKPSPEYEQLHAMHLTLTFDIVP